MIEVATVNHQLFFLFSRPLPLCEEFNLAFRICTCSTGFQENNGWVKLTCSSVCRQEPGVAGDGCYERIWFPVFSMLYPVRFIITGLFLSMMLSCDWLVCMMKLAFFLQCSAALHIWQAKELLDPTRATNNRNEFISKMRKLQFQMRGFVDLVSLSWDIYMDTFSTFQESATLN